MLFYAFFSSRVTTYQRAKRTPLIFIFTTVITRISTRFSIFNFHFSVPVCVCSVWIVCEYAKILDQKPNQRNPHPPNLMPGFICIDYSSLFFSHNSWQKHQPQSCQKQQPRNTKVVKNDNQYSVVVKNDNLKFFSGVKYGWQKCQLSLEIQVLIGSNMVDENINFIF